jgi:uncharacterized protein (UPF0548 family)
MVNSIIGENVNRDWAARLILAVVGVSRAALEKARLASPLISPRTVQDRSAMG